MNYGMFLIEFYTRRFNYIPFSIKKTVIRSKTNIVQLKKKLLYLALLQFENLSPNKNA